MRPLYRCPGLFAICYLWLSWLTRRAHAWAWGPYHNDWKQHYDIDVASQPLVYRAVLPRNGTTPTFSGNGTYSRPNATGSVPLSTSTPTAANSSTNATVDTSCGVTSPLFALQISGAEGSFFKNWWLKLSGDMVLFTKQKEKATGFGVNAGTGHLCIPRAGNLPLIAFVETRPDSSPLYFVSSNYSGGYQKEYQPITCGSMSGGDSQLACSQKDHAVWSGCGLQLELASGQLASDGTLNCSSIALSASPS